MLLIGGRFRRWRRSRPFWGGLLTAGAGVEIYATATMSLGGLSFQVSPSGFLRWLIPTILVACGLSIWLTPQHRMFFAVIAAVTTVYSLVGVNLGGFLLGLPLGIVGSALAFAWTPVRTRRAPSTTLAVLAAALVWTVAAGEAAPAAAAPAPGSRPVAAPAPGSRPVAAAPARLTGSRVTLTGLRFGGVVALPTAAGPVRTLLFRMDRATADDPVLRMPVPKGRTLVLRTGSLTVDGSVAFYATRFHGRLLGVPLTFDPDHPPPLVLRRMVFDDPDIQLALVTGATLTAPGLRLSFG